MTSQENYGRLSNELRSTAEWEDFSQGFDFKTAVINNVDTIANLIEQAPDDLVVQLMEVLFKEVDKAYTQSQTRQ